jgi:hypothetical protein
VEANPLRSHDIRPFARSSFSTVLIALSEYPISSANLLCPGKQEALSLYTIFSLKEK